MQLNFKHWAQQMYTRADRLNRNNILEMVRGAKASGCLLDLGCDDGEWTTSVAQAGSIRETQGIELVEERAKLAESRGIKVYRTDLASRWPIPDGSIGLVHANQVIEHVPSVDHFMSESFRVLAPGGVVVISTENGSSWHNIFAAIMGWQIFSLTNVSARIGGLGNPLALHQGEANPLATWTHKTIFNYCGLRDFMALYGFESISVVGAGYYPLPAAFGLLDVRHSHFISAMGKKPAPHSR